MATANTSRLRQLLLDLNLNPTDVDNWLQNPKDKSVKKAMKLVEGINPDATDVDSLNAQVDALAAVSGVKRESARRIVGRAYNVAIPNNPKSKTRTEADIAREVQAITAAGKSQSKPLTMPSQPMPRGGGQLPDMRGDIDTPTPIPTTSRNANAPAADLTPDQIAAANNLTDEDLQGFLGGPQPTGANARPTGAAIPTTPTRGKDSILGVFDPFGIKADGSKILADIDNGVKIEPTDKNIRALLTEVGIEVPKEKSETWMRNIRRLFGRTAGDIGKDMEKAGEAGVHAKAKYALGVATNLKMIQDAAGGSESAVKAMTTGKAAGWARDTLASIKPSFGKLAMGIIPAMIAGPVIGSGIDAMTGAGDAKKELQRQSMGAQTFEDLWEQYQLQKAMSRAQSRMNVDFPNTMGSGNPLAGPGPSGSPTAQMPTDPNANPGDIVLPGGVAQYNEDDYSPVA